MILDSGLLFWATLYVRIYRVAEKSSPLPNYLFILFIHLFQAAWPIYSKT